MDMNGVTMNILSLQTWEVIGWTSLLAAILAAVGYVFGWVAEIIVRKILRSLYYEEWFKAHGVDRAFLGINITDIIATLVKWWVFIGFFAQAVGLFGLPIVTEMAKALYAVYISLALGIIYLVIGAFVAKYVGIKMRENGFYGGEIAVKAVQAVIMYFAAVTALPYFGIRDTYIITRALEMALWAAAAAFALGFGLAFGLGAQDVVKEILSKKKKTIEEMFIGKK